MSITSQRRIINQFDSFSDYSLTSIEPAAQNIASPGMSVQQALITGNNTITPPTGAVGCTIVMPAGNTVLVTLKGVNGDTGVVLHKTDPSSIGLNSTASFVLNASGGVIVQIIWS